MWQWQFLFHSWRGVDFVHLKCFRYFEGSRIRFFGDCEQFEESSSFFFLRKGGEVLNDMGFFLRSEWRSLGLHLALIKI